MEQDDGPRFPVAAGVTNDYFPLKNGLQWEYVDMEGANARKSKSSVKVLEEIEINSLRVMPSRFTDDDGSWVLYNRKEPNGVIYYGADFLRPLLDQVTPHIWIPLPIEINNFVNQIEKSNIEPGFDYDGDGKKDKVDMKSVITMGPAELVSVPAGTYRAIKIETELTMLFHLTKGPHTEKLTQRVTQWLAKGVGPVKKIWEGPGVDITNWPPVIHKTTQELEKISF